MAGKTASVNIKTQAGLNFVKDSIMPVWNEQGKDRGEMAQGKAAKDGISGPLDVSLDAGANACATKIEGGYECKAKMPEAMSKEAVSAVQAAVDRADSRGM